MFGKLPGLKTPESYTIFFKYAVVGFSGALVNMGVLYLLTDIVGLFYLFSSIIAIELSIINNFYWNDSWTFSKGNHSNSLKTRILTYHAISIIGAIANVVLIYTLTSVLGIYYLWSNVAAIIGVFVINYLVNSRVTWKKALT
jgi:dolichol-phosphate mannosyltransferase